MTLNRSSRIRRARQHKQEKRRRQLTAGGVVIGAIIIVAVLIRLVQPQAISSVTMPDSLDGPANANNMAWGPQDALVIIEEFSDFQ